MNPVITIPEADLVAVLGDNGEHWTQGAWENNGSVCLHGAIRACQPQPGDAHLLEQVANLQGWGIGWHDRQSTTWPKVRERLSRISVSDTDLSDTFGPQWEHIVTLVRRAATLTQHEAQQLHAARNGTAKLAWNATWNATRGDAALIAAARAAGGAGAATDAAGALAVRDLIGQHHFTQTHYDTLTGPWRAVIGPVHPDDPT